MTPCAPMRRSLRVRPLQDLVEQEQQRRRARRQLIELPQARDLRVEARAAFVQRVVDADARADLQRREPQTLARTGAPAIASTVLMPTVRSSVLLPDMFEPLISSTRVSPRSLTSLRTQRRAAAADGRSTWPRRTLAFDELREGIVRMLVAVAGQRDQRFDLADRFQPDAHRVAVMTAPAFRGERDVHAVEQRQIQDRDDELRRDSMNCTTVPSRAIASDARMPSRRQLRRSGASTMPSRPARAPAAAVSAASSFRLSNACSVLPEHVGEVIAEQAHHAELQREHHDQR